MFYAVLFGACRLMATFFIVVFTITLFDPCNKITIMLSTLNCPWSLLDNDLWGLSFIFMHPAVRTVPDTQVLIKCEGETRILGTRGHSKALFVLAPCRIQMTVYSTPFK